MEKSEEQKRIAGILPADLRQLAARDRGEHELLARQLQRDPPPGLDAAIHHEHHSQFESIDCLDCANCCRTTPALLKQPDMERISSHLGISMTLFLETYVEMDEDGDFVTKGRPCPFLAADNACTVYDVRPGACRDFPLTALDGQADILDISLENRSVCPAVYRIFQRLEQVYSP